jgi:hypothetical protein
MADGDKKSGNQCVRVLDPFLRRGAFAASFRPVGNPVKARIDDKKASRGATADRRPDSPHPQCPLAPVITQSDKLTAVDAKFPRAPHTYI